jgi:transcriptional regulator with XRE-family HTH domain
MSVKKNIGNQSDRPLASRIKELRKSLRADQKGFAALVGVSQAIVSQWETGKYVPARVAILRMSDIAPTEERQWWRDQAADLTGSEVQTKGSNWSVTIDYRVTTIPLLKDASMLSSLGSVHSADIEQNLSLPAVSPLAEGEIIVLVDISRRDPDRMVDRIVAIQTGEGVRLSRLRKLDSTYILNPLKDGSNQSPRILKLHGENSIVGQVVKWICDAEPQPTSESKGNEAQPRIRSRPRKSA